MEGRWNGGAAASGGGGGDGDGAVGGVSEGKTTEEGSEASRRILTDMSKTLEERWERVRKAFTKEQWERIMKRIDERAYGGINESVRRVEKQLANLTMIMKKKKEELGGGDGDELSEEQKEIQVLERDIAELKSNIKDLEEHVEYSWEDFKIFNKDKSYTEADKQEKKKAVQEEVNNLQKFISNIELSVAEKERKLEDLYKAMIKPIGEEQFQELKKIRESSRLWFDDFKTRSDERFAKIWEKQLVTPSGSKIVDWASKAGANERNEMRTRKYSSPSE